jgi:hypothetical protein
VRAALVLDRASPVTDGRRGVRSSRDTLDRVTSLRRIVDDD